MATRVFNDYCFESILSSSVSVGGSASDPMIAVDGLAMPYREFVRHLMDFLNADFRGKDSYTKSDNDPYRRSIHRLMEVLRKKPDSKAAFIMLVDDIEGQLEELNTDMVSIMLSNVGPVRHAVGEPVKGAGYFGHTAGLHTVSIRLANFQGLITIEGTISYDPSDDDWFPVVIDGDPDLKFPRIGSTTGETVTLGYTFRGNYVWLRATMDRTYFTPENATEEFLMQYGRVDAIKLL